MSSPYIGEIRMFGGNFAPAGWTFCQGQLMPISQNDALFTLIGTTYGGDGQETFGIPDLQGRVPVHAGQGPGISQSYIQGEKVGVESVTLTTNQIPVHNHAMVCSTANGTQINAEGNVLANVGGGNLFLDDTPPNVQLNAGTVSIIGGSQPHDNLQPYLCISFILSLFGIFPHQ